MGNEMTDSPATLKDVEQRLSSRALAKAIFEAELPEQFVRTLPSQSLYIAVRQTGLEESADILELASIEQQRLLLDFDLWEGDKFSEDRIWEWLALTEDKEDFQLLQKTLKSVDLKLVALLISRYVETITFDDAADSPPGPGFYTPDKGHTWIHLKIPDSTRHFLMARFLALIFETSAELFYQIISVPTVATDASLEEEAFQDRSKRLAGEGIPDAEYANNMLAPISIESVRKLLDAKVQRPHVEGVRSIAPLLFDTPFDSILKNLLNVDGESLEEELTLVMNCAVVQFRVDFADTNEIMELVARAKGAISIGIELARVAAPHLDAVGAYKTLGFARLFGLGLNELQTLHTAARKISEEKIRALDSGEALFSIIAALRERFPRMPRFVLPDGSLEEVEGKLTAGYKAIESMQEIGVLKSLLSELQK